MSLYDNVKKEDKPLKNLCDNVLNIFQYILYTAPSSEEWFQEFVCNIWKSFSHFEWVNSVGMLKEILYKNYKIMDLKKLSKMLLEQVEWLVKECEENGLTNSQWYIEFEDNLNLLSVKDHNAVKH